jgi:hypothetical protein
MSLISTFVDAVKRAAANKREKDLKELIRNEGGTLGSTPAGDADKFNPLRPTPEDDSEQGIDSGDVSVASADPEEGGESDGGDQVGRESVRHDARSDEERR